MHPLISVPARWRALLWMAAVVLAGCTALRPPQPSPQVATPAPVAAPMAGPEPVAPALPVTPARSAGADALREGLAAYQLRNWRRAETQLNEALRAGLHAAEQIDAHKTLAFTYCVTQRTKLCEQSFGHALAVEPRFELSRAERGHPLWGPVFTRVQRRMQTKSR